MISFVSYNILEGGADRFERIVHSVRELKPDIVTLQEVTGWDENDWKQMKLFAFMTGFTHYEMGLSTEDSYHVATLSKFPIIKHEVIQGYQNPALHIVVDTNVGELSICNTHLSPGEESHRVEEIDRIITLQKAYDNAVIVGDLNSLSIHDAYRSDVSKEFNMTQLRKFTRDGRLVFDVTNRLETNQYKDVALTNKQNEIPTVPTVASRDSAHNTPMRLDYAFVSLALSTRIYSYEVVKNEVTNIASDHYPIHFKLII